MSRVSFLVLLALIVEGLCLRLAHAQVPEIFHGSPLRKAFDAGIIVSATSRDNGVEVMRILATTRSASSFLKRPFSVLGQPELDLPFQLTVGPPAVSKATCSDYADDLTALDACFDAGKPVSFAPGVQILPMVRYGDEVQIVLFKSQGVVPGYARCLFVLQTRQFTRTCDIYFWRDGERHWLSTSSLAVLNMKLFQCAALELRNAIWPGAPRLPDGCEG